MSEWGQVEAEARQRLLDEIDVWSEIYNEMQGLPSILWDSRSPKDDKASDSTAPTVTTTGTVALLPSTETEPIASAVAAVRQSLSSLIGVDPTNFDAFLSELLQLIAGAYLVLGREPTIPELHQFSLMSGTEPSSMVPDEAGSTISLNAGSSNLLWYDNDSDTQANDSAYRSILGVTAHF